MKIIKFLLSENIHFLVAKFSVYLNRRVFVMPSIQTILHIHMLSRIHTGTFLSFLNHFTANTVDSR